MDAWGPALLTVRMVASIQEEALSPDRRTWGQRHQHGGWAACDSGALFSRADCLYPQGSSTSGQVPRPDSACLSTLVKHVKIWPERWHLFNAGCPHCHLCHCPCQVQDSAGQMGSRAKGRSIFISRHSPRAACAFEPWLHLMCAFSPQPKTPSSWKIMLLLNPEDRRETGGDI